MKKDIGNLALIAGVIIASIGAAESQRVTRVISTEAPAPTELLHTAISTDYETREENQDMRIHLDRTIEAGTPLTADVVEWLRLNGYDEVHVLRRAKSVEAVPANEDAVGRVLAEPIVLDAEIEEIRKGRIITADFEERLIESELANVLVAVDLPATEEGALSSREDVRWDLRDSEANPAGATLQGSKLREVINIPHRLKKDSYIDADTLARLSASGIAEATVKIPKQFAWQEWEMRWFFVVGALLTLGGVLLKRSRPATDELAAEEMEVARIGELLVELEEVVEILGERVEHMDAPALHEAVDPILTGPVFEIGEGRNSIRLAHGMGVFTAVMDPFARSERKLNRAWSAAVDGYPEEARNCLRAALAPVREAREALPGAQRRETPPEPGATPLPPDVPIDGGAPHWTDEEV